MALSLPQLLSSGCPASWAAVCSPPPITAAAQSHKGSDLAMLRPGGRPSTRWDRKRCRRCQWPSPNLRQQRMLRRCRRALDGTAQQLFGSAVRLMCIASLANALPQNKLQCSSKDRVGFSIPMWFPWPGDFICHVRGLSHTFSTAS